MTQECNSLPSHLQLHYKHELGPNFINFGIVEHPVAIIDHRLSCASLTVCPSESFDHTSPPARRWTDGSVLFASCFWLTSAAYAVVDENETCILFGSVHHVCLSSFAAELYAFLIAVSSCTQRIHVFTDSRTVVDMFEELIQRGQVAPDWTHKSWWSRVLFLWVQRSRIVPDPIRLT